jgi:hypothetical protein
LLYNIVESDFVNDPAKYQITPLMKAPIYIVAHKTHPIQQQSDVMRHLFRYAWVLPNIPQRFIALMPEEFKEFVLDSNTPEFVVGDLHQALDLAQANQLIIIAVGDLSLDSFKSR